MHKKVHLSQCFHISLLAERPEHSLLCHSPYSLILNVILGLITCEVLEEYNMIHPLKVSITIVHHLRWHSVVNDAATISRFTILRLCVSLESEVIMSRSTRLGSRPAALFFGDFLAQGFEERGEA